ncbi:hypothetical protein [Streptomyces sp. NPDC048057]|uniref:hypothetical protein n=1 Tax=Streptomyces sp. NPDC048057 TaxID=3155628 RepID=UPI0033F6E750
MTPQELLDALHEGGMPFADDDPDYCPDHGWNIGLYHHSECEVYASRIGLN